MRLYKKQILQSLQDAIDKTKIKMKTFKDYSFLLPGIKIAELKLKFVMTDDKRDVLRIMIFSEEWQYTRISTKIKLTYSLI